MHINAYPFIDNKDDTRTPDVPVANVMTRREDMRCLDASQPHTVSSLSILLATTSFRGYPVLSSISPLATDDFQSYPGQKPQNILLGYISRLELSYALDSSQKQSPDTSCYFVHDPAASPRNTLDLRPWMDQTPMTLHADSTLQLAVAMFQKLGLRYLLFVDRGSFKGMLTKKDLWWILNAGESNEDENAFVAGAGVLREETENNEEQIEERGLLREERDPG